MPAKISFLKRITSLERSIGIEAVSNKSLTEHRHNDVARLLRNGLAVVGFAALEDFVKTRTQEIVQAIGGTTVPFSDLPEKLRHATTFEAISALQFQMSLLEKTDRLNFIQEQSLKIASTSTTSYELSPFSLGFAQSNVSSETIGNILKCFLIKDPWIQMTAIASRLNLTGLSLEVTYKNAMSRRHRAAHTAHEDTPQTDLSQFIKEANAIAISFDCLLSRALEYLQAHDIAYLSGAKSLSSGLITFRYLKQDGAKWKEYTNLNNRALRVSEDYTSFQIDVLSRARAANQVLIEMDANNNITSWECI